MLMLATLIALGWLQGTNSTAGEAWQSTVTIDKSFDHSTTAFPLLGKHVAVTCESCHYNAVFKGLGRACNDCHNGKPSPGGEKVSSKPAGHIPAGNTCNDCHSTATWKSVRVDHRNLSETCATCHNGKSATSKPTGHVPTTTNCKGCHNTSTWVPVRMDHSDMAGPCGLCHDGRRAIGKPVNHIKTSANCDTCHAVAAWKPAGFAHHGISGNCASCHNGVQALGKVAGHTPTSLPCETCHASTLSFSGTAMNHVGISSGCASCHTGAKFQGKGKPASHFQTSLPCETCHKNFVTFSGTTMNHQGISDGCARCHTGLRYQGIGKVAGHIPTAEPCEACHSGFMTFSGTYMNHHGITSGCAACHNDQKYQGIGKKKSTATGLPHPVTSLPCEHCHSGFFTFANATIVPKLLHGILPPAAARVAAKFTHSSAMGACASCHNGAKSTGKPKTHFVTARACDICHATAAWVPIRFRHTSANYPVGHAATLACRSCHTTNAEAAPYKSPGLKPSCAACHFSNYKLPPHPKVRKPVPQYYTVPELKDCAGACHVYADGAGHNIVERRALHHRAGSGGF